MKDRIRKKVPQKNQKASRKQFLQHKSDQNNKYLRISPCKILILKLDKGGIQTYVPKN